MKWGDVKKTLDGMTLIKQGMAAPGQNVESVTLKHSCNVYNI